jgi:hypothetical protein
VAALCAVVLAGCRLDIAVDVEVEADGTGEVTVVATADAGFVDRAPLLADDLAVDDLRSLGWDVTGPEPTDDGGLVVRLTRSFADDDELERILGEFGGPFHDIEVSSFSEFARTTWSLDGVLRLDGGIEGFADAELVAAANAVPYADDLAADAVEVSDVVGITLRLTVPGSVVDTTALDEQGVLVWRVPLDGTSQTLGTLVEQRDTNAERARTIASVAQFVLVVWIVTAVAFIGWVALARRRRQQSRRV